MADRPIRVLVVDDEAAISESLAAILVKKGMQADAVQSGEEAVERFDADPYDVVVTDIRMPGIDGIELTKHIKGRASDTLVLLMTAHASLDTAVEAMREGASDYLTKPVRFETLIHRISGLTRMRELEWENRVLRLEHREISYFDEIIGKSEATQELKESIRRIGPTAGNVLIEGESGTGKELVARAIHAAGARRGAFVPVNCGSIPETLMESEFFGHVRGSFTGAERDKSGLFQEARDGTLFLDEIGELPLMLQPKILRAIEAREVRPVGETRDVPVNSRIVAATNRDLEKMVGDRGFREDLYFRLNVYRIIVPPLRDRVDDIAPLASHFVSQLGAEMRSPVTEISPDAMAVLESYPWRGNVRELQNVVQRALITATRPVIDAVTVEKLLGVRPRRESKLKQAVGDFERHHIQRVLDEAGGDKRLAAEHLDISLASLYAKLKD